MFETFESCSFHVFVRIVMCTKTGKRIKQITDEHALGAYFNPFDSNIRPDAELRVMFDTRPHKDRQVDKFDICVEYLFKGTCELGDSCPYAATHTHAVENYFSKQEIYDRCRRQLLSGRHGKPAACADWVICGSCSKGADCPLADTHLVQTRGEMLLSDVEDFNRSTHLRQKNRSFAVMARAMFTRSFGKLGEKVTIDNFSLKGKFKKYNPGVCWDWCWGACPHQNEHKCANGDHHPEHWNVLHRNTFFNGMDWSDEAHVAEFKSLPLDFDQSVKPLDVLAFSHTY